MFSRIPFLSVTGRDPVQLISRYWRITNSEGRQTEVQGKVSSVNNR